MKKKLYIQQFFLLFALGVLSMNTTSATHILGGELSHEYIGNDQYIVTAKLYRDCNGIVAPTSITAEAMRYDFGYSVNIPMTMLSVSDVTQVCPSEPTVCSGTGGTYGVELYTYQGTVTINNAVNTSYSPTAKIVFYWGSCCLPANNVFSSGANQAVDFYSIAYLPYALNNSSPLSTNIPTFNASIGDDVVQSTIINDVENDSLIYSLTDCVDGLMGSGFNTASYNTGYSGTQPFSTTSGVTIDSLTGNIRFSPTIAEMSLICLKVEEYRNGIKISEKNINSVMTISNDINDAPKISGINGAATASGVTGGDYIVSNIQIGQTTCFDIKIYDDPTQNTNITWVSNLNNATYNLTGTGATKTLNVCWTRSAADTGAYHLSIIAEDDNCPLKGKSIRTYKSKAPRPYILQGQIFRPNGNTTVDAVIRLYDTTGTVLNTKSTTNGFYQFVMDSTIINQSYYLSAEPNASSGDLGKTYSGNTPVFQYATSIPIYLSNYMNTMNITLVDTADVDIQIWDYRLITGVLKSDLTGAAIPNVRMVLVDSNDVYVKEFISTQDGTVNFHYLGANDYEIWVDQIGIDNDIAPSVDMLQQISINNNIEMLLHNTYLELSYPTNTQTIKDADKVNITPNPSSGVFNIRFPMVTDTDLQVFDLNGRILKQQTAINTNNAILDLSNFPSQVYLIRLTTENGVVTKRIVKR